MEKIKTAKEIADLIKKLIKQNKISANKLLLECNLSKSLIYDMSERNVMPSADKLAKIADYFNVSTDYLLGKTNNPNPADADVTFDDFTFAFYEETKELSDSDKENLLDMARMFNQRRKERQKKDGE